VFCDDVNTPIRRSTSHAQKQNGKISSFLPVERAWMDRLIEHGYLDAFRVFYSDGGNCSWWDLKTKAREKNVRVENRLLPHER